MPFSTVKPSALSLVCISFLVSCPLSARAESELNKADAQAEEKFSYTTKVNAMGDMAEGAGFTALVADHAFLRTGAGDTSSGGQWLVGSRATATATHSAIANDAKRDAAAIQISNRRTFSAWASRTGKTISIPLALAVLVVLTVVLIATLKLALA